MTTIRIKFDNYDNWLVSPVVSEFRSAINDIRVYKWYEWKQRYESSTGKLVANNTKDLAEFLEKTFPKDEYICRAFVYQAYHLTGGTCIVMSIKLLIREDLHILMRLGSYKLIDNFLNSIDKGE